jgi:hypothetical protein
MPDRLALKRLTASDLTFFEHLFRTLNVGNQKSINLNADVFVEELYPNLPALAAQTGDVILVSLTILGPAGAPAHVLSRKITKQAAYKNWRLNGEFIRDPEGEPARYDSLAAGDLGVMDFTGDPLPQKVSLLLVSQTAAVDKPLYSALSQMIPGGRKTMVAVSRAILAAAAADSAATHPIWQLAADPEFEAALEDAALGGLKGVEQLSKKSTKVVSAAALAAAKASAEKNGHEGEALAWVHLQKLRAAGSLKSIEWSSQSNAVSPFDFLVVDDADVTVRIDAKSTSGDFNRPIHMSIAELLAASTGGRYDIWRLYELDDYGACLKIASNIASTAKKVLAGLSLPKGVSIDGVSIDPTILSWSEVDTIEPPDEDDVEVEG